MRLRIVSWNLNHRARQRRIPPEVALAIRSLEADLVVLTEYVEGDGHGQFIGQLASVGFCHVRRSTRVSGQNQVLAASRLPLRVGTLRAPALDPALPSNVLHVSVGKPAINVVGMRVPAYISNVHRQRCWDWLLSSMKPFLQHRSIFVGDFNVDPVSTKARCGPHIAQLVSAGWRHAWQEDGWSYCSPRGFKSRIDHAFVSPQLDVASASYVAEHGGYLLAGAKSALSDHAALLVELSAPAV